MRDRLLKFIEDLEGNILHVYKDVAGYDTVGVGYLITSLDIKRGYITANSHGRLQQIDIKRIYKTGISKEESYQILDHELDQYQIKVPKLVKMPLNDNQLISLISFSFNVGIPNFERSTLLRLLNQGDYNAPVVELPKWRKAGGKVVRGLINRREKEVKMWKGIYA